MSSKSLYIRSSILLHPYYACSLLVGHLVVSHTDNGKVTQRTVRTGSRSFFWLCSCCRVNTMKSKSLLAKSKQLCNIITVYVSILQFCIIAYLRLHRVYCLIISYFKKQGHLKKLENWFNFATGHCYMGKNATS